MAAQPDRTLAATRLDEEAALVVRARAGEAAAFRPLVERYQARIYNLCLRLLGRRQDAEDAAQDAFLRAWDALSRYDVARPFVAWLVEIAVNVCRDRRRAVWWRRVIFGGDTAPEQPDPTEGAEATMSRQEALRTLVLTLQELKPADREALAVLGEELPAADAARSLGISVNALYVRQTRARARLAALLRARHPELFADGGSGEGEW